MVYSPQAQQGPRGCVVVPFWSPPFLKNGGQSVIPHLPLSAGLGSSLVVGHLDEGLGTLPFLP